MANKERTEWLADISKSSGATRERVEEILASRRIQPSPVTGTPRRLLLKRIQFKGRKKGIENPGPFEFIWDHLDQGLWAMLTDRNLKGKSSVIEIVRWMLRGRPSERLQDDVRSWLETATLTFGLDEKLYEVRIEVRMEIDGDLVLLENQNTEHSLAHFTSNNEFEAVMADFFMREFALEAVTNFSRTNEESEGKIVTHTWPALAGVMFIGTNYSSLLGDLAPITGVPIRLMQMYLGLPWISTLSTARTVLQTVRAEHETNARRRKAIKDRQKERVETIKRELVSKQKDLAQTLSDERIRETLASLSTEYATKNGLLPAATQRVTYEQAAYVQMEAAYARDRHDLQAHLDAEAAGAVFRMLDPTCCPRCEFEIGKERKEREKMHHSCSVCGETVVSDQSAGDIEVELRERVKASQASLSQTKSKQQAAEAKLQAIKQRIEQITREIEALTPQAAAFGKRAQLQTDIAILEARISEASREPDIDEPASDELKILEKLVDETDVRVKFVQSQVLKDVSSKLTLYAKRFGMEALESAELKGNLNLPLIKGGSPTNYGSLTQGEKLRVKIATVLAIISVAETNGIGRHPGLLMIDSPGAQEVTHKDLEELIKGLEEVAKEFSHLQVFIAAISTSAITQHVSPEHTIAAKGENSLW